MLQENKRKKNIVHQGKLCSYSERKNFKNLINNKIPEIWSHAFTTSLKSSSFKERI